MLTYVGIYILFALACFLVRDWNQERIFIVFASIFLVIFTGARLDTGCDFQTYYFRFTSLNENETFREVIQRDEPGFWIVAWFIKSLGLHYVWVNLLGAALFFFCLYKFALRHPNPALIFAIAFPIMVVQLSMSGFRQAMAVAFLMMAVISFFEGSRLKVIVFILIGAFFHESLVMFLPLSLAIGREFSVWRLIVAMILVSPVALIFSADRIDVYSDRYVDQIYGEMESSGALFRTGLIVLTACAFEFYKFEVKRKFPKVFNLLRIFSLLSFMLIPLTLVSTVIVHRVGYYILPVQLYTLALLPYVVFPSLNAIHFGRLIPLGVYAAYVIVWFSFSKHAKYCYIPYESYIGF